MEQSGGSKRSSLAKELTILWRGRVWKAEAVDGGPSQSFLLHTERAPGPLSGDPATALRGK